jgi:general secretion pathway protein J
MSPNQPQSRPQSLPRSQQRSQRRSQRLSLNHRYAEQGFTLLEVLVAISIFAIIGLGANQMLRTVINTHDHTQASIKLYSEFSHAMAVMERDLSQAVPRGIRDEFGDQQPAFLVANGPFPLEFTRTGWNNPIALPRSNLQRVAYEMNEDNALVRSFWTVLDRAEDAEPIEQILLTEISDFRINVIGAQGDSGDTWPDQENSDPLPIMVEVVISADAFGDVRKVFPLVSNVLIRQRDSSSNGQGNNNSNNNSNNGANDNSNSGNPGENGGQEDAVDPNSGRQGANGA